MIIQRLLRSNKTWTLVVRSFSSRPPPFSSSSQYPNSRFRKPAYLLLGLGSIYLLDTNLNASSLSRTLRTFSTGALIALDYKINFQPHPPFAQSIPHLHARNADRIYNLLLKNGGLYLKIGQAIAMQSAVLPPEFQKRFATMFDDAPQNTWSDVERVIRNEFGGRAPEEVFGGEIEHTARASASIAQVHRARLPDGRIVAVKVQKKEIAQQVAWDLWAFARVMYLYEYFFDLPLSSMVPYISERLASETDFLNEARNAKLTASHVSSDSTFRDRVYVPKVHDELSTRRVMTAEWIDGVRINDKDALTKSVRDGGLGVRLTDVMSTVIELFSKQIFLWGDVHCDPHPGNILIRRLPSGAPQVVLLDHGLYIHLSSSFRLDYARFWTALMSLDNTTLRHIASSWGVRDSEIFASMTLMRPYSGGSRRTEEFLSSLSETKMDDAERAFALQQHMRAGLRDVLGDETLWPRALLFLGRTIRIMQADNQMLGSPVNRLRIMSLTASRAVLSSPTLPQSSPTPISNSSSPSSQSLISRARSSLQHLTSIYTSHIRLHLSLLSTTFIFYLSRVRQILGWGDGMESDLERAMNRLARGTFGVELNHSVFDG